MAPCGSCLHQKDLYCVKWQVPVIKQSGCDVGSFSGRRGLVERELGLRRESAHTKPTISCHTCVHMHDDKACGQIKRVAFSHFDAPMVAKVSDQTVCANHSVREKDARKTFEAMHEYRASAMGAGDCGSCRHFQSQDAICAAMKRYAAQKRVDMDVFTQEVSACLLHVAEK